MTIEQWQDIKEYTGRYQVSNLGRIKSLTRKTKTIKIKETIMRLQKHPSGYLQIALSKKSIKKRFYIHRLVLEAFLPIQKNKLEANHKDGDKTNNLLENLEWVSRSYNHVHAYNTLHKPRMLGSKHPHSKLTEEDVLKMRQLFKDGVTKKAIAKQFGIAYNTAQQIIIRRRWKHI